MSITAARWQEPRLSASAGDKEKRVEKENTMQKKNTKKMSWFTLCPSHANRDLSGARLALPSNEFSMQQFIPTSKIITTVLS